MRRAAGPARGLALAAAVAVVAAEILGCASAPEREETPGAPLPITPPGVPSDGERAEPLAPSRTHVVKPGETLWRISKRYGSSPELVAKVNRIANPAALRAGQRLVIPAAGAAVLSPRLASPSPSVWNGVRGGRVPRGDRFVWPVQGYVSSGFGIRDGAHHTGLDIRAPVGTVVRAAESGRVVHANAKLEGYGNMIIIRHSGRFSTVYAHNHRNLVRPGDFVEKGQVIAEVGQTGRASAPHLHFEVRRDGAPDDPLDYLP